MIEFVFSLCENGFVPGSATAPHRTDSIIRLTRGRPGERFFCPMPDWRFELSTASLRPDWRLCACEGASPRRTEVPPSAYVTHSRSPEVGGILECGGKRSATPLSLAQLSRESRVTSRFVRSKITPARKKRRRRFALPAHSKMRKRQWR